MSDLFIMQYSSCEKGTYRWKAKTQVSLRILAVSPEPSLFTHTIWASSWDYGTYHKGNQQRLRRACASAQSRQSHPCSHTLSMEVADQKSDIKPHWMAAHVHWKNEFTEDKKYHDLTTWLIQGTRSFRRRAWSLALLSGCTCVFEGSQTAQR